MSHQHVNLLKNEAHKTHPIEACAILFGKMKHDEAAVRKVVVTSNKLNSTVRFEIDPEDFAEALAQAEMEGLDFIGLFHSHQAPTFPSPIDQKCMKLWSDAIWLILSSANDSLAAYQICNNHVKEVDLILE